MEEAKPVFVEYARVMISFLVEVRGIALDDLEPELVADAMIRGAADESVVWRERERWWNDSYHAAAQALAEGRAERGRNHQSTDSNSSFVPDDTPTASGEPLRQKNSGPPDQPSLVKGWVSNLPRAGCRRGDPRRAAAEGWAC